MKHPHHLAPRKSFDKKTKPASPKSAFAPLDLAQPTSHITEIKTYPILPQSFGVAKRGAFFFVFSQVAPRVYFHSTLRWDEMTNKQALTQVGNDNEPLKLGIYAAKEGPVVVWRAEVVLGDAGNALLQAKK